MKYLLQNKIVVITGASSGIGEACAREAARRGARVVLVARNLSALEQLQQDLQKLWGKDRAMAIVADVSVEEDCRAMCARVEQEWGGMDVLINNAGISMRAAFEHIDLNVIRKVMDVNFWGTVYCTRFALTMIRKRKGMVVGVSSIAGYKGLPGRTGYSASKFAMQGFLESLRLENLGTGLGVLVVCPGFTRSNIRNTALDGQGNRQGESPRDEGAMMSPEEVARLLCRAIEQRRRNLILTTNGKLTVWLNKFFPAWMDGMVYRHMKKEPDAPF